MAKYHKYVFDSEKRSFVGNFEEMYKNESTEIFDSWHQEDTRRVQRKIALMLLSEYNFLNIIDLGCGKGTFSHLLKKINNSVTAIDISETAIAHAYERYSDIDFIQLDISNTQIFTDFISKKAKEKKIDLVLSGELFSYLSNWKEILKIISNHTEYFLIFLYIPDDPIGYVKSEKELVEEVSRYFDLVEWISIRKQKSSVIFGKKNQ